jgi:hypothetical protein
MFTIAIPVLSLSCHGLSRCTDIVATNILVLPWQLLASARNAPLLLATAPEERHITYATYDISTTVSNKRFVNNRIIYMGVGTRKAVKNMTRTSIFFF